ncbi:MAG: hypothetical protein AAGE18_09630 [Pseudomonadota bacterium]
MARDAAAGGAEAVRLEQRVFEELTGATRAGGAVRHRQVFFVPGFDPMPPRRYRELYRREGARQAQISGYTIGVRGVAERGTAFGWNVVAEIEGQVVRTEIAFLQWEDLVRNAIRGSIAAHYLMLARTFWTYVRGGSLRALARLRWEPMIAALAPPIFLVIYLVLAILLGALATDQAMAWLGLPVWLALGLGLGAGMLFLWATKRIDRRLFAYYMLADYAYAASAGGATPPDLAERIELWADRVAEARQGGSDEILVIGHSAGAHLAAQVTAATLRRSAGDAPLSLLTIGQSIPMVSFLPTASDLRRDLHQLARSEDLFWLDVTARGDGACFALCDPVAVTGVDPEEREKRWPLIISAAYKKHLSSDQLEAFKWRFFRKHIQYMCAFDRPGDYDYFRITAGPKTLAERFGWRGSSRARIVTPLSPFRDMDP